MNKEDKATVIRLYEEGYNVQDICYILDKTSSSVYRALKGVKKNNGNPFKIHSIRRIMALRLEGKTYKEIASILDLHWQTVRNRVKDAEKMTEAKTVKFGRIRKVKTGR